MYTRQGLKRVLKRALKWFIDIYIIVTFIIIMYMGVNLVYNVNI
jgi:hypothetical protein